VTRYGSGEVLADAPTGEMHSIDEVLRHGAVSSVFQPIVDLDRHEIVAYEALARGPVGELQSPAALFAEARRTGNLARLDHLCRAAAFSGALDIGLLAPQTLFVNVEPEVVDTAPLESLLALSEEAPGGLRVVLEITERALAARPAELLRTVARIREVGWGVALDDVGAHPASLTFMPLLQPDVIKLDLSLVQRRPDRTVAEIMNAVNAHAEATGAVILAEGIETHAHVDIARSLGARLGQGWLLGRPTPHLSTAFEHGALALPSQGHSDDAGRTPSSPFACLPSGAALRVSTKPLLVQISKQLEREALRLGETCLVAATFQEARHFTPATTERYAALAGSLGFVAALGKGLPAEPLNGVRGADIRADDDIAEEWDLVVLSPHFSAALLARDLGRAAGALLDRVIAR
jgi:EAL domain-containing protein (putative c-di-GMP-specific phosphodiesterase class I)